MHQELLKATTEFLLIFNSAFNRNSKFVLIFLSLYSKSFYFERTSELAAKFKGRIF